MARMTTPAQTASFVSLETRDPADFEIALRPWELMARPGVAGGFRHAVSMYRAEGILIYHERFNLPMVTYGLSPKRMLGIGISTAGSDAKFWGMDLGFSSCPMILSGPLEVSWTRPHAQYVAFTDVGLLEITLSASEFERLVQFGTARRAPILQGTRRELLSFLRTVLAASQTHSRVLANTIIHAEVQEKLTSLLGAVARQSLAVSDLPKQSARKRSVSRVCDYLTSSPMKNVWMSDLCQVAGVSERSLQYAFKEELGVSARDFMTMRRLHAARRSLRVADPKRTSVSEIAMEHGFFELGRFAGQYHACFGELPSETLGKLCVR